MNCVKSDHSSTDFKNSDFPYRFSKLLNILKGIDSRKQNRHVILLGQIHTSLGIIKSHLRYKVFIS